MHWLLALLFLAPICAWAQFKCVSPDGAVSFQQAPCAGAKQEQQRLNLRDTQPAGKSDTPSRNAPGTAEPSAQPQQSGTVEQRMLVKLERERKVRTLEQELTDTENAISNRNAQMTNEMATLRANKQYAKNNLAGATWEQSISTEMAAVAAKYKSMNDVDIERVKQLRTDLAAARKELNGR